MEGLVTLTEQKRTLKAKVQALTSSKPGQTSLVCFNVIDKGFSVMSLFSNAICELYLMDTCNKA